MRHRWEPKLTVAVTEGETRCIYCGSILRFATTWSGSGELTLPSGETTGYCSGETMECSMRLVPAPEATKLQARTERVKAARRRRVERMRACEC
jgi:hypothetical protein